MKARAEFGCNSASCTYSPVFNRRFNELDCQGAMLIAVRRPAFATCHEGKCGRRRRRRSTPEAVRRSFDGFQGFVFGESEIAPAWMKKWSEPRPLSRLATLALQDDAFFRSLRLRAHRASLTLHQSRHAEVLRAAEPRSTQCVRPIRIGRKRWPTRTSWWSGTARPL